MEIADKEQIKFTSEMSVELIDTMGDDLRIVNAARVSLKQEHQSFEESDIGLIKRLIRDEHGTPFEKVRFEFRVEVPMFIARQWFKHRFSSFNEASGRYSELEPKFYIPEDERVRAQVGKAMSYKYETHPDSKTREEFLKMTKLNASLWWIGYKRHLALGIAKELARIDYPGNIYTKFYWGIDLRNLVNFLVLRNDPHAQMEIVDAAKKVEEAFKETCPVTYSLWNELGRPRLAGID